METGDSDMLVSLTVWETKYRKNHVQLLCPGLETFSAMMPLENLGTIH